VKILDWGIWAGFRSGEDAAQRLWGGAVLSIGLALTGCQQHGAVPTSAVEPVPVIAAVPPETTGPLAITWEQLDIGMPPDTLFEPWMMTTQIKALEGRQVRLTGYMCGAIFQRDSIRNFPLMREIECPFGPGGQAHHVVEVELQGKLRTSFTTQPVTVLGTFSVQPQTGPNGKTWSLYKIDASQIY
jgi:hypothetical protein